MLKRPAVASAKLKSIIERPQDGRNFFPEMQQQPGLTTGSEPRARKPNKPATQAGHTPSVFTTTHSAAHFLEAAAKTPSKLQFCPTLYADRKNQPIAAPDSKATLTRQNTPTHRITVRGIRQHKTSHHARRTTSFESAFNAKSVGKASKGWCEPALVAMNSLLSNIQLANDFQITLWIMLSDIIQQRSTLANHAKEAAATGIVASSRPHVRCHRIDSLGQKSDLDIRGTAVGSTFLKRFDQFFFSFFANGHSPTNYLGSSGVRHVPNTSTS